MRELEARLELLGERVRPASLAAERTLPLVAPLAAVVPGGALARGSVVGVAGPGATSLGLALLAEASRSGSWTAAVGVSHLGLVAASELGVDLGRLVLVDAPPVQHWPSVVATLAEAFDLVLVRPRHRVRPGDARRLVARLRERGGVLCHLPSRDGAWPDAPDLALTVTGTGWRGVDPAAPGAGHLRARRVVLQVAGRRSAARPRTVEMWLPGPGGTLALARPVVEDGEPPAALEQVG